MKNPGLPEPLWEILDGRLWHATGPEGLTGILADGEIRITGDRYQNSFCRQLKCVALFDFGPTAVDNWNQFNNWQGWFGHQQDARVAIWLEIDRRTVTGNVIDAGKMHQRWEDNLSKQIIPGVEAGHHGPVPIGCVGQALLIDQHDHSKFALHAEVREDLLTRLAEFERSLPPAADPGPLIAAMRAYRQRGRGE